MRPVLVLLCLFACFQCSAQRLVCEACASDKRVCDSTLRAILGDKIYSYLSFDTSTRAMTTSRDWLVWNDTLKNDSIKYCRLEYTIQFPGALPSPFFQVPIVDDTGIYVHEAWRGFPKCNTVIDSVRMDSITRKLLKKPLKECEVYIYNENCVGTDKNPIYLDTSHVYFMVAHRSVTVKEDDNYVTTTTKSRIFVVDACTGYVPEKPEDVKTKWQAPKH